MPGIGNRHRHVSTPRPAAPLLPVDWGAGYDWTSVTGIEESAGNDRSDAGRPLSTI